MAVTGGGVSDTTADDVIGFFEELSNWGRWGNDDRLGTLNLITPDKRRQAAGLVHEGIVVSLSRDIDAEHPDPLHTGISNVQRSMEIGEVSHYVGKGNTRVDAVMEHVTIAAHGSNTHLDGLAHYTWDGRTYNGFDVGDTISSIGGSLKLSVRDAYAGIISRGVLLDIAGLHDTEWLDPGHAITIDELEAAQHRQNIQVTSGDVLILHTGHVARTLEHGVVTENQMARQPGLHASCLPWLRGHDIAALGSDAIQDVQPSGFDTISLIRPIHAVSLVALGLWLVDNMELTELVTQCRNRDRYEFFFAMLPWRMVGVTSSATNPVAMF